MTTALAFTAPDREPGVRPSPSPKRPAPVSHRPSATPTVAAPGGFPVDAQAARRRRLLMLVVLGLHLLVGSAMWVSKRMATPQKPAPLTVNLLSSPTPPAPKPEPLPLLPVLPMPKLQLLPPPVLPTVMLQPVASAAPPAVLSNEAPAPRAQPTAPAAAALSAPAPAVVAPPAPPSPKQIAPSSLRYLVEPRLNMPLLSRRLGEQGLVHVRIVVDAQGRLKEASVQKSSGFERLDQQALQDIRSARFVPHQENGQPIEVISTALLSYELER